MKIYNLFQGKMRVYSIETEKVVRIVSLPVFDEPVKRYIYFLINDTCTQMISFSN